MNKAIILSVDCVINPTTGDIYNDVANVLNRCHADGDDVIFIGHSAQKLDLAKRHFNYAHTTSRQQIRSIITQVGDGKLFLVIGCHDEDAQVAFNSKILLLCPLWATITGQKVSQYGIHIQDAMKLERFIKTLKNQSAWYFELDIDNNTKILSLMNAQTRTGAYDQDERALVESFEHYLKRGDRRNYETLLYHFISGISNNNGFRDIQNWGIYPSSSTNLNIELNDFKERSRTLMFSRGTEPILLRHRAAARSHSIMNRDIRIPCDRHFDTIHINPHYRGKLRGRNICIFDDYLTNGTSFETARNLLRTQNVNKMLFVSLGKFRNGYVKQNYRLEGDVFTPGGYTYQLIDRGEVVGNINTNTKTEIENLHDIFFG